jgi:nucleoside phosphorylase
VHSGLIASGDRSLRSARKRDEFATAYDVIAIEMESKGLGNSGFYEGVEWFTVRGISDYGDRHVTPTWRSYASMAAAAYVRALLAVTPATADGRQSLTKARHIQYLPTLRLRS